MAIPKACVRLSSIQKHIFVTFTSLFMCYANTMDYEPDGLLRMTSIHREAVWINSTQSHINPWARLDSWNIRQHPYSLYHFGGGFILGDKFGCHTTRSQAWQQKNHRSVQSAVNKSQESLFWNINREHNSRRVFSAHWHTNNHHAASVFNTWKTACACWCRSTPSAPWRQTTGFFCGRKYGQCGTTDKWTIVGAYLRAHEDTLRLGQQPTTASGWAIAHVGNVPKCAVILVFVVKCIISLWKFLFGCINNCNRFSAVRHCCYFWNMIADTSSVRVSIP